MYDFGVVFLFKKLYCEFKVEINEELIWNGMYVSVAYAGKGYKSYRPIKQEFRMSYTNVRTDSRVYIMECLMLIREYLK